MCILDNFLVFFSEQGTICHHSSTTKVQGRSGIDFKSNFGVILKALGHHLRSFSVCFLNCFSSLFSEVFFSGPGQTLNGFNMHSGVRWDLDSIIWMTFAGSGDPLFLNNTMVV